MKPQHCLSYASPVTGWNVPEMYEEMEEENLFTRIQECYGSYGKGILDASRITPISLRASSWVILPNVSIYSSTLCAWVGLLFSLTLLPSFQIKSSFPFTIEIHKILQFHRHQDCGIVLFVEYRRKPSCAFRVSFGLCHPLI